VSGIGKPTASRLSHKGSWVSSYIQLYTAFTISALIHTAGDIVVGAHHFGRSFPFFFIQAVAITLEDTAIALAKRTSLFHSPFLARALGFTWVGFWFASLMPYVIEWCVDLGFTRTELFPFSPTRFLLRILFNIT